ncbi:putative choline transporter, neither null mutation nor overexpression affects choline transport [Pichia californica]|uniref:Protein PNS1 n=1 Tax=Pichia californica TaxID=460514 RepID=A0A9P7BGQ8_9ASCO|nr:putative choline transporter, neither null mutation nor overexpression affects choline transport [[Candida] californica]KAG0689525.1 putative choline transporter, neither null mutation nor overexpression affects choline transport [[Candida] californica]
MAGAYKKLDTVEAEPVNTSFTYKDDPTTVDSLNSKPNHETAASNTPPNEEEHAESSIEPANLGAHAFEPESDNEELAFSSTSLNPIVDGEDEFRIDDDRFTREKPVWNDVKFAIFFLVVFLAFTVTSMIFTIKHIEEFANESSLNSTLPNSAFFQFKTILLIIFISLVSFGVSVLIFILAGKNSAKFTTVGLRVISGIFVLASISGIFVGQIGMSLFYGLIATGIFFIIFKYNPLISLAATIMNVVITVLKKYPSTALAALIGFFSSIFFAAILQIAVGCAYISFGFHSDGSPRFDGDGNITSKVTASLIFTIVFLNFTGLYIIDVLKNVMHVTIGGIYGTWYYTESTFEGMPKRECSGSFKRAMTYSFGSVCYGSLFVVIFQVIAIYFIINNNGFIGTVGSLTMKGLGIGVGYFNLYAYSFVALYGVEMIRSAKSTYSFFKQRGLQAILNDFIIGSSMGFYCIIASIFSVLITYIYLTIFKRILGLTDDAFYPLLAYSFMITLNITSIMITTVISGSSVFFFALNKDPAVFQESNPFEFQEISRCYPKVLTKLQLEN